MNTYVNSDKAADKKNAAIVELNKEDARDMDTLFEVSHRWEKEGSKQFGFKNYVEDIISNAVKEDFEPEPPKEHYYALTLQKDKFEKLKSEDILGLSLFSENNDGGELNFLQVRPKTCKTYQNENRPYKNIGTAIIDFLKEKFTGPISVNSAHDALGFYLKKGFLPYDANSPWFLHYIKK